MRRKETQELRTLVLEGDLRVLTPPLPVLDPAVAGTPAELTAQGGACEHYHTPL